MHFMTEFKTKQLSSIPNRCLY